MKNEETTSRLDDILEDVHTEKEADDYISSHTTEAGSRSFPEYLSEYAALHDLKTSDIIRRSRLNTNYVYNIINKVTQHPGRDKILALCIGAGMNRKETDRALRIAGHSPLYAKDERDVRIIICINNEMNDVLDVNLYLEKHKMDIIDI